MLINIESYFGTQWEQGNTLKNVVWFKCKNCDKRLKVVKHFKTDHFNENGNHEHFQVHDEEEKTTRGIPLIHRPEIDRLDNLCAGMVH